MTGNDNNTEAIRAAHCELVWFILPDKTSKCGTDTSKDKLTSWHVNQAWSLMADMVLDSWEELESGEKSSGLQKVSRVLTDVMTSHMELKYNASSAN